MSFRFFVLRLDSQGSLTIFLLSLPHVIDSSRRNAMRNDCRLDLATGGNGSACGYGPYNVRRNIEPIPIQRRLEHGDAADNTESMGVLKKELGVGCAEHPAEVGQVAHLRPEVARGRAEREAVFRSSSR